MKCYVNSQQWVAGNSLRGVFLRIGSLVFLSYPPPFITASQGTFLGSRRFRWRGPLGVASRAGCRAIAVSRSCHSCLGRAGHFGRRCDGIVLGWLFRLTLVIRAVSSQGKKLRVEVRHFE